MTEKKKLGITLVSLVVVIALSVLVYNIYKDRVDPMTGKWNPAMSSTNITVAAINAVAPDITMQDAEGKEVKLSDFKGKPVVLNFWASSCVYCKSEMPYFESAFQKYGDDVQFIMLNIVGSEKSKDDGRNYLKTSEFTFPVFYETADQAMQLYGLRGLPATIFINADGTIAQKAIGAINEGRLTSNIDNLLA